MLVNFLGLQFGMRGLQFGTTWPTQYSVNPMHVFAPLPCENLPAREMSVAMHFDCTAVNEQCTVRSDKNGWLI
ncbi:MAG: hypothetical protein OXC80_04055 [Gammaproteobacteria bacterium]|nr:hypothetical protein [Gammaproteobacteria bacterium]